MKVTDYKDNNNNELSGMMRNSFALVLFYSIYFIEAIASYKIIGHLYKQARVGIHTSDMLKTELLSLIVISVTIFIANNILILALTLILKNKHRKRKMSFLNNMLVGSIIVLIPSDILWFILKSDDNTSLVLGILLSIFISSLMLQFFAVSDASNINYKTRNKKLKKNEKNNE